MSRHPMRLPIYISGFLRYPRSAPRTVLASPRRHLSFLSASSREHRHRFPTLPTSRHQQREYPSSAKPQFSTMASATQFYDFKPLNSESPLPPTPPVRSATTRRIPPPARTLRPIRRTQSNTPQKRARRSPSPTTRTASSSSSTRRPSAASPLSTRASRSSTRTSPPSTLTSRSSASPATSSAARSPAPTTTSRTSARSTTACPSPS